MLALLTVLSLLDTPDGPPAGAPAQAQVLLAQAPPAPPAPVAPVAPPAPAAPPAPRAPRALPALPALPPGAVAGLPGGEDVLRGDWPAAPSGARITIEDHVTVDDAIEEIAKKAGWSVSINTGRVGERLLVLKLRDTPVEEALRAALSGTGLTATRRGRLVSVAPAYAPVAPRSVLNGFDKPSGRNFTGEFSDLDGRDALLQLGKATGLSLVLPAGSLGKVTATFKDAPVEDVLRAVLGQLGLQATREGGVITVTNRGGAFAGAFDVQGELGPAVAEAMQDARREIERATREAQPGAGSGKDIHSTGGDVTVDPGQEVRDVQAVNGSVTIRSGASAREVVAVLGSVTLEPGASARQVVAIGGDIKVGPGAAVERDAVSIGGRVQVDPSGDVGGKREAIAIPRLPEALGALRGLLGREHGTPSAGWRVAKLLGEYLVSLALGMLLVALFPRRVEAIGAAMVSNPGKSLLAGLLGWLAQPFLTILLIVTIVGIPLVLVQALLVALAVVGGFTALSWLIGRSLPPLRAQGSWVLQLAAGTGIAMLIFQIPVLGWMAVVTASLVTFGAVLRTRFGQLAPEAPLPTSPAGPFGPAGPPPFAPASDVPPPPPPA